MHLTRPHCHKACCWKPSWHKHSNTVRSHNGSHVCSHSNYTLWQEGAELSTFLLPPPDPPTQTLAVSKVQDYRQHAGALLEKFFAVWGSCVRYFGVWQSSCSSLLQEAHVEFGYVGIFEHTVTFKWHILYGWWTELKYQSICHIFFLYQKKIYRMDGYVASLCSPQR